MLLALLLPTLLIDETAEMEGCCKILVSQEGDNGMELMAGSARESALQTPQYPADVVDSTAGAWGEPKNESDTTRPG